MGCVDSFTEREDELRRLLRARDHMDRHYAEPLDVAAVARVAHMSAAHFTRRFRQVYAETPHRYLQRRRIERACAALRDTARPITDIALDVGYDSLGTFSRTFRSIIGRSPSDYRRTVGSAAVPGCFIRQWTRPNGLLGAATSSSFGEAGNDSAP